MNLLASLLSLVWVSTSTATVVWNAVDDPRCHETPNRPILEPSPGPTPFPPTEIEVYDPPAPPTPTPLCPGLVTALQIVDLDDESTPPVTVENGMTISLSQLPQSFTIEAVVDDSSDVSQVKFFVGDQHVHTDSHAPFYFKGDYEFSQLYVAGTYTISAMALSDGSWESDGDACALQVIVEYGNPTGVCEGLVTKFALFDTTTQAIVPGYESLADGQDLDLKYLPDHLSIVAISNGRGGEQVTFTVDGTEFEPVTTPFAVAGTDDSGIVTEWTLLRESGSYTIQAKMLDRLGQVEEAICQITVVITSDWICLNEIEGFSLIDAELDAVIPGYEHMAGNRVIDLADIDASFVTLRANKVDGTAEGVVFYVDGNKYRTKTTPPYSVSGSFFDNFYPSKLLADEGQYVITAVGMDSDTGNYESIDKACMLDLTITDTSYEQGGPVPPDTILTLIDNDDGPCAPKLVTPLTEGNHMYYDTPVKVVELETDEFVRFKVYNYILDSTMDWITTSFVTTTGVEVCDKVENVAFNDFAEHIYEAKCHDGYAYVDVFAYSGNFSPDQASADTSALPDACKNDFEGQVVRYTFVFSCNCEETPEIPDVIVGGVPTEERQCVGRTGGVMGDPHVKTFDWAKSDCMGAGEYVLSKAVLDGYPYNFEANGRFWKFDNPIYGSWASGVVAKQDVSVQLTIAESQLPYSTMFGEVPVNFYVDGVPRLLTQGSGDHRVIVTVKGHDIEVFFVSTGINIKVEVRPGQHNHIYSLIGFFNVYVCYPSDNDRIIDAIGLFGNNDGDPTNDWTDINGNKVDVTKDNDYEFCTTNWCVRDEAETLFTFDDGYDFAYYNRCDQDREAARRLSVDLSSASDQVKAICATIEQDDEEDCLFDGTQGGANAAQIAADAIRFLNKAHRAAALAEVQDEAACCSRDFKTCDESCGTNKYLCGECDENDTFTWLEHGDLDGACRIKATACSTLDECCPGLECSSAGVCSPAATPGRRLQEFVFVRPDLPLERNIIAHSDLF